MVLVDVREPNETAVERFPGAVLVPLSPFDRGDDPGAARERNRVRLPLRPPLGRPPRFAAQEQGFAYDAHMAGGLLAWKAAGLPTET